MKQIYSTKKFKKNNYSEDVSILVRTPLNKCAINDLVVYLDKYYLSFKYIERIEFNKNKPFQLSVYLYSEVDGEKKYSIIRVKIEDFDVLKKEWLEFIGDMFYEAFMSKEEE